MIIYRGGGEPRKWWVFPRVEVGQPEGLTRVEVDQLEGLTRVEVDLPEGQLKLTCPRRSHLRPI